MVAGKVKAAMGLQKSPATPKQEPTKHFCSPSSQKAQPKPVFSRSFGVYFPRSAQVQPRPPDCFCGKRNVSELLRLVDELQAKESRLQTEVLEYKLLKESVNIVPFLEKEIQERKAQMECSLQRIESLEAENEQLRREMDSAKAELEAEKMKSETEQNELLQSIRKYAVEEQGLKSEIAELRKVNADLQERNRVEMQRSIAGGYSSSAEGETGENDDFSASQKFQGLVDVSVRSNLLKSLKKGLKGAQTDNALNQDSLKAELKAENADTGQNQEISNNGESKDSATSSAIIKIKGPRIPKPPPPRRSFSSSSSSSSSSETTVEKGGSGSERRTSLSTLPPISPPPKAAVSGSAPAAPPPPPPPPPSKGSSGGAAVRRVPEVAEFYHSLMRRDSKRDSGAGVSEIPAAANARNMIGEIENRSAHLLAIKTDVETQGDFIRFLMKEVHNAAFADIEDVVAFVKWLDDELSFLVDERAVLKHFDWPEHKADALREAAFGYGDLKKLESEASSFRVDIRQPCGSALKKMQALLEKLEHSVYNLSRMREGATKRYKGFQIPWDWMLDNGVVSQIKLASVKLAKKYMKRVAAELEAAGGWEEEELLLQGVRFAFRVHQFAGGFDVETMRAFLELRNKARSCHIECQTPQQQKLICRSTSC